MRAGTPNLFLRFARCNLACKAESEGFDCDTEFESGRRLDAGQIIAECKALAPSCEWMVATGGEPALQLDAALIAALHQVETNGSRALPAGLDWITVSPKVAEHAVRQRAAHEVKYVRGYGQAIPRTVVEADHYLISPAFDGLEVDRRTLDWCIRLCKENPPWRLSVQQHKLWNVR